MAKTLTNSSKKPSKQLPKAPESSPDVRKRRSGFDRLVSLGTLRTLSGMKGLRFGTEAFKTQALIHLNRWLDTYQPTISEDELDPKVAKAVYEVFQEVGQDTPYSRDALFLDIAQAHRGEWENRLNTLKSKINRVFKDNSDFRVEPGPKGGTTWTGETDNLP